MTKSTNTQIRGICQCCGREQAVVGGTMSKHGYTVEAGWFKGVCTGQRYEPMQVSRNQADAIVAAVLAECVTLRQHAADLRSGKVTPLTAKTGGKVEEAGVARYLWKDEMVPFAQAKPWHQEEAVRSAAFQASRRAELGEDFAATLSKLADEYHGKELSVVAKAAPTEQIEIGEQRDSGKGSVWTVTSVLGARVYWKNQRGFKGWTGTQAFRKLAKV